MQTKWGSLLEQVCNVGSGFLVSLVLWQGVLAPLWGYEVTFADNLGITTIFTVVSVLRGYAWRRWFNGRIQRRWQHATNTPAR